MSASSDVLARVAARLREVAPDVELEGVRPLTGGACQELWRVDLSLDAEPFRLVLRSDARRSLPGSLDRAAEFAVIDAAVAAGVPTPAVRWLSPGLLRPGTTAYFMDWCDGVALGGKVTRAPELADARRRLPEQLAAALAAIHKLSPATHELPLPAADVPPVDRALSFLRAMLDGLAEPRPAMEATYRWLLTHPPLDRAPVLTHGDFRVGNFLVDHQGLVAVLDWEFAHWGCRAEDVAWLCVRDWRFGRLDRPAGGLCDRAAFLERYAEAGGPPVTLEDVHYWEVMGNLRWAAGAVHQGERYLSGAEHDLELLAIGRRAVEMEYEALRLIAAGPDA